MLMTPPHELLVKSLKPSKIVAARGNGEQDAWQAVDNEY
jgi:hypothetical protein